MRAASTIPVALLVACVLGVAAAAPQRVTQETIFARLRENNGGLRAGVAKVNATMPTGVPLAGYNHGARAVKHFPLPHETTYTTFMAPSIGHLDTTWAKALLLDTGDDRFMLLTIDAIGSDGTLLKLAVSQAQARGVNISLDRVILSASHSHSGPGALTPSFLWAIAPAMDLLVPEIQLLMASRVADAMVQAQENLQPASLGVGTGKLYNVTTNRRAHISPYLQPDSIDPNMGVIRIDTASGTPLATVYNFAIHGVCWGPDQMLSNTDIMGGANIKAEALIGGVVMFVNADAGDIDPTGDTCANKPDYAGAPIIAAKIKEIRDSIKPSNEVAIKGMAQNVNFGPTDLNFTLARWENCTTGGPLDICTLCRILDCKLNARLNSAWIEDTPMFSAWAFTVGDVKSIMVTMPGEPLSDLGFEVRGDLAALGFDVALLAGYSNSHMGYFATPQEYDIGGYESQLTFWGIETAEKVRASAKGVAELVKP